MSANSTSPRRRWGCLTRLLVFLLFIGACYFLLLAPLPGRGGDQTTETSTPETPSEGVTVEGEINSTQQAILEELADETGEQVDVLGQNGQIRFLEAEVYVPDSIAASVQEKALYFFSQNADLIQIQNPATSLFPVDTSTNNQGVTTLRFEQKYQGIPVYSSSIVLKLSSDNKVISFSANYVPNLEMDVQPTIRSVEAEQIVLSTMGGGDAQLFGETTLIIYAPEIWSPDRSTMKPALCWLVLAASPTTGDVGLHVVNAKTGELLDQITLGVEIGGEPEIEVRDAQGWTLTETILNDRNLFGEESRLIMDENGYVTGAQEDPTAAFIQQNVHLIYSYFWNTLGRDSYDDDGMLIKVYFNVDDCWPRWVGDVQARTIINKEITIIVNSIFMCPDWVENIDVFAHEFTHGVIAHSSNLIYQGESAALNEAYADIFAAFLDEKNPWIISRDVEGTQIRRRLDDPKSLNPDYPLIYNDLVTNAENCPTETDPAPDCPHTNSTIWSHAFYLLTREDNSVHPNLPGIEIDKLQFIYYETMINLPSGAGFKDAAKNTISVCDNFSVNHRHGVTLKDCDAIRFVFANAGLITALEPSPNTPLPQIPEIPNLLDLFYELIENLRQAVDDLLGDWSPLKWWEPFQEEIDRIRNNYWVKLLECIQKEDQACIDQYWADLINAIFEMIMNALCNFCSSLIILPGIALTIRKRKRMIP